MTRAEIMKYASDGKYFVVSILVEDTGTIIDYVYIESEKEKAISHAKWVKEEKGEEYVSFMECEFKSVRGKSDEKEISNG